MAWLKFMAKGRWHIGVLGLTLVLAQSIGLIHGIAHAPLLTQTHAEHASDAPHSFVEHLFGDHQDQDGNAKCRLFDQSKHLDGRYDISAVVLPTHLAAAIPAGFTGLTNIPWFATFHARGPPTFP